MNLLFRFLWLWQMLAFPVQPQHLPFHTITVHTSLRSVQNEFWLAEESSQFDQGPIAFKSEQKSINETKEQKADQSCRQELPRYASQLNLIVLVMAAILNCHVDYVLKWLLIHRNCSHERIKQEEKNPNRHWHSRPKVDQEVDQEEEEASEAERQLDNQTMWVQWGFLCWWL